jgi:hypothetical protein
MKSLFTNTKKIAVILSLVCLGMSTVSKASTLPVLKVGAAPSNSISFEVSVIRSKAVVLSWESATAGNAYYEVEQSFDNSNFKTVGLVLDGFDIQNSDKKSYKFKDDNVMALKDKTVVYYRLKQIDTNGVVTNSDVMTVKLENNNK